MDLDNTSHYGNDIFIVLLFFHLSLFFLFYRACLIATVRSSGASQSTIKLVATNLIANGKLSGTFVNL